MSSFKTFLDNHHSNLTQAEILSQLLTTIDLPHYRIKRIDRTYRMDHDRFAVIFVFQKQDDQGLQKGIVDVKHGQPSWQQMMDVTFGVGQGCDLRIAMFDGKQNELDNLDTESSQYYAQSFGRILNACEKETHLVRMRASSERNGVTFEPLWSVFDESELQLTELPSKQDFERAEFCLFFYGKRYFGWKPRWLEPRFWFQEESCVKSDNVELTSRWKEDGIHLVAVFRIPMSSPRFLRSLKNKLNNAWGSYNPVSMEIKEEPMNGKSLNVWLSELPFRNFVLAGEKEREELATYFDLAEQEFLYFIEEVIEENAKGGRTGVRSVAA